MVKDKTNILEKTSQKLTNWIGTPQSIVLHTILFISIFLLQLIGFTTEQILLILTTAVSLEAIYLAIFIQMTVNRNTASLEAVEDDIEDIQEDVEELSEDVEEITEDVGEISEEVEGLSEDVEVLTEDVEDELTDLNNKQALQKIENTLQTLLNEIESLKKSQQPNEKTHI